MKGKLTPLFQLFEQQFENGKTIFESLSKAYRGKKAIELEQSLIFLEIYIDLLSHIHFKEEKLKFKVFAPFKDVFKGLKKTKHIKMILSQVETAGMKNSEVFNSYTKRLLSEKNTIYTDVYNLIVAMPLQVWDDLYREAYGYSKGLKPLMINTSTNQIITEELEYFQIDNQTKLTSKALKDIYEGLRIIIALENIRVESGLNAVFIDDVHARMSTLQKALLMWYENHLFMQHLTSFLAEKEAIPKKYKDLLDQLHTNKKTYTDRVLILCKELFVRILE